MAKVLTRAEYLQLLGLQAVGTKHTRIVDKCEQAMADMLGLVKDAEFLFEIFTGDKTVDQLLEDKQIEVAD